MTLFQYGKFRERARGNNLVGLYGEIRIQNFQVFQNSVRVSMISIHGRELFIRKDSIAVITKMISIAYILYLNTDDRRSIYISTNLFHSTRKSPRHLFRLKSPSRTLLALHTGNGIQIFPQILSEDAPISTHDERLSSRYERQKNNSFQLRHTEF